jgi:hypothetical protein
MIRLRRAGRTVGGLLLALAAAAAASPPADPLDQRFGMATPPAYVKHYEAGRNGKVLLNPYLQRASPEFPALLDPGPDPIKWVIDTAGRVVLIREVAHPLGRTYPDGFHRPEDDSDCEPGYVETYGHVSALGGAPGRIGGEIWYDEESDTYTVNNKSGRYTKHNSDRTPEQLVEAARRIREVVDPGGSAWGPAFYLIDYAPAELRERLLDDPRLEYDDPATKLHPHLVVLDGEPSRFGAEGDEAGR